MISSNRGLEIRVGLFVLLGLGLIATGIILFGRFGEFLSPRWNVIVTFPNASGLVKGSTVYYAGAPIGRVDSEPQVIDEGQAVKLNVWIYNDVKIRKDSRWVIGSSGLLGDRFIDVQPRLNSKAEFVQNGDLIKGTRVAGVADLAESAAPLIEEATLIVADIRSMVSKFREEIFTDEGTDELRDALEKFKGILTRVDEIMNQEDLDESSEQLKSILTSLDEVMKQAKEGNGMLGKLLYDKELARDITAFVTNIRKNGVLFYKDSAEEQSRGNSIRDRQPDRILAPRER